MQRDNLIIFEREIRVLLPFAMGTLHEEGRSNDLANLSVVLLIVEVGRNQVTTDRSSSVVSILRSAPTLTGHIVP